MGVRTRAVGGDKKEANIDKSYKESEVVDTSHKRRIVSLICNVMRHNKLQCMKKAMKLALNVIL